MKSACRAEMKKAITYMVDVKLSAADDVEEAQCECGAGMGPTAHCKHVCAVLYGCYVFNKSGLLIVESTCTDKLQSFHKVKRHAGSPIKACDLKMDGADESTCVNFDLRPAKFRKWEGYEDYFRNTCLNYSRILSLPIFQLFKPASVRAVASDHDYLPARYEDSFLESMGLLNVSDEKIRSIEISTRGQSRNSIWVEERSKRIQSSNFGRICKATERTDMAKLAQDLTSQKTFKSKATYHGRKFEREAIIKYEEIHQCKVGECGIYVSRTRPFLGTSPDGMVSKDVLLEVKCPFTARDKRITPQTVPYLKVGANGIELDKQHNYHYQVQGQMFCHGAQYCDFIVYTLRETMSLCRLC